MAKRKKKYKVSIGQAKLESPKRTTEVGTAKLERPTTVGKARLETTSRDQGPLFKARKASKDEVKTLSKQPGVRVRRVKRGDYEKMAKQGLVTRLKKKAPPKEATYEMPRYSSSSLNKAVDGVKKKKRK